MTMHLGQIHWFEQTEDPADWIAFAQSRNYGCMGFPMDSKAPADKIDAFATAAREANLIIAEVGAWSNPISPDEDTRKAALTWCQQQLALADRVGARVCVNIAGSRSTKEWHDPHPDNFSRDTFDLIVESVRTIIDAVKPKRTCYCLESMPWVLPDSAESYLEFIKAIDRPAFACHFDPVNILNSHARVYDHVGFLQRQIRLLGPYLRSLHLKDVTFHAQLLVHIDECRPGTGMLQYGPILRELGRVQPGLPIIMEHLQKQEEYDLAAQAIREAAHAEGIKL